jgi:RNA polymerase sigma-70 factor (sigma-E family)
MVRVPDGLVSMQNDDFESLYASAYAPMVRLAYLLTGSPSHAEEAVQEAFVRVWERWSAIDEPGAYLRTTVVHRCRSLGRRTALALRRGHAISSAAVTVDRPHEMLDTLATLSKRRREVVVLRFYCGLSINEIADALGVSSGTVKATLHHALHDLRKVHHD